MCKFKTPLRMWSRDQIALLTDPVDSSECWPEINVKYHKKKFIYGENRNNSLPLLNGNSSMKTKYKNGCCNKNLNHVINRLWQK